MTGHILRSMILFVWLDLQNIVLIRDPEDATSFYPRFNLEDTSSFEDLDDHRLYHDYYFQRQETLWWQNALKTLPVLLNSSDMLARGEDLGLIPSCVHLVMQELGLIGLRIQRMPSEPGLEFGIPSRYSYMTVRSYNLGPFYCICVSEIEFYTSNPSYKATIPYSRIVT
ncbi:hypothetical protein HHK36_011643 [Tetracentron sinense]|uniref:4-alpha-glucanotransferase n=1 Tax=Tetracentron sinense TaxID=13715 RepID=A0A834Z8N0_TETSI|nr:hypothetical protein HHK36_011643 [Tetracentron sinense]